MEAHCGQALGLPHSAPSAGQALSLEIADAPEKNALNAEEGNGHYPRLALQDAYRQLEPDQAEQGSHDRSPQIRHHLVNRQFRPHPHPLPHLHRTASQQPSAYEASDASTPTRSPSTSSFTLTQPSTFPSATSRAPAVDGNSNFDNTDARDTTETLLRGDSQATGGTGTNNSDDNSNILMPDYEFFAHLHHYPSSQQHQHQIRQQRWEQQERPQQTSNSDSIATLLPPRSLLASPQLGLRSRLWRNGPAGAAQEPVSRSRSRDHSHSGRISVQDKTPDPAHQSIRDDKANDDAAESVNSHALAWDQTCLRIAYLVGTMVTPSANVSVGGGDEADGPPAESPAVAWNDSQTAVTNSAQATSHDITDSIAATHYIMPGFLENFAEQCTKGWAGAKPLKKRRKIAQIMHWQNEVSAYFQTVYCGCAEGNFIPFDSLHTTIAPATAPALQLSGSNDAAAAAAGTCEYCVHPLTPKRPVVWVSDPKDNNDEDVFKKARRSQESGGDNLRKVLKSIRGLVLNKKSKRNDSMPATSAGAAVAGSSSVPLPPTRIPPTRPLASLAAALPSASTLNKFTTCRRAWSQWDDINSDKLRNVSEEMKALYFPQTAMYHVQVDNPEVSPAPQPAKRSSSASLPAKEPVDIAYEGKGKMVVSGLPRANGGDGCDEVDEEYDPDDANSQSGRNKLQEMQDRLRRAERLLRKSATAAAQTTGS